MARARRFEHTPRFKHAIAQVFEDAPPAVQTHMVVIAQHNKNHPTSRAILEHVARRAQTPHPADIAHGADMAKAERFRRTPAFKRAVQDAGTREVDKPLIHIGPLKLGTTETYRDISGGDVTRRVVAQKKQARLARQSGIDRAISAVTTPVLKDYVEIPANIVPATYQLGKTAVTGHPGKAVSMLAQPYKDFIKDPVGSFKRHPLGTALLFAGPKSIVGKTAGRVGRLAPEGSAIERAASTVRRPATLPGTSLVQTRRYSPDVLTKATQVAREKTQIRNAHKLATKAAQAVRAGDDETAHMLRQEAQRVDPRVISDREVRRRMNERVAANEGVRRLRRAQVTRQVDDITGRKPTAALNLVAQGIVKPTHDDLLAYHDELATQYPTLKRVTEQRANRRLRQQIQAAMRKQGDPAALQDAAVRYEEITGRLQRQLVEGGMLEPGQANMAKLIPYAVRHMDAHWDGEKLVTSGGNALSADTIRAHMQAKGVPEPAYVTQAPRQGGKRNYYVDPNTPQALRTIARTGEATRRGTFDAGPEVMREGVARMQGLVDAHQGFSRMVNEFGLRDGAGEVRTFTAGKDAQDTAAELNARGEGRWRAIRVQPFAGRHSQLHDLLERTRSENQPEHQSIRDAIKAAIGHDTSGPGPWAVVPDAAADQLANHIRVLGAGAGGKAWQAYNSVFRRTVLATSPRWLTGNVVEAAGRAAINRAGPRSLLTGHRALRALEKIDPAAAEELAVRATSGGHYSMADRMPVRRAEQFEGTRLEGVANKLAAFWRAPGPKQAAATWHAYTDFVFHTLNRTIESQFQTAMLGAHVRRNLLGNHTLKLSKKAIDEAAHGLRGTDAQVELARAVDRAYGQYDKFGPGQRRAIALYTPFVAWTLNALRFVSDVLPKDHPALTSALVAAHQTTEQWRKEHGLDKFIASAAPGFLQGSIPIGSDAKLRLSRYTPFGAYSDPGATAAGAVLPQLSGVLDALQGRTFSGQPLKGTKGAPPNDLDKARAAAVEFVSGTIPFASQAQTLVAAGPRRAFDPFVASKPKPKKPRKGRGSKKAPGGVTFGGTGSSKSSVSFGSGTGAASNGVTFGGG